MTVLSEEFRPYLASVFNRKPQSVTAIDVEQYTSYTDVLVIVEAGSHRQVTAIAEHIITRMKADKITALGTEGIKEGEWALLDYGNIIIHVFETRAKTFYDLEGLWGDAPRIDLSEFASPAQTP